MKELCAIILAAIGSIIILTSFAVAFIGIPAGALTMVTGMMIGGLGASLIA